VRYRRLPAGNRAVAEIAFSNRADGDFHIDGAAADLDARRRGVFDGDWSWLRQVHGSEVVVVDRLGAGAGTEADGAVTGLLDAVLCVQTADCVPVVLVGDGAIGVSHAGWRGLVDGIIGRTVDAIVELGGGVPSAIIGPCIRPAAYEFGEAELRQVEDAVGGSARSHTADGSLALDLAAATSHALGAAGVSHIDDLGVDTADEAYFSHRVRGDAGRQVTAARLVAR